MKRGESLDDIFEALGREIAQFKKIYFCMIDFYDI